MPGVGDQRRRVDAPAHDELVPGHDLVADDAECRAGDAGADVGRVAVLDQLADALEPGERGAGPDHHGDPDPGQVLGPFQAVGVPLGRRPARQPEAQEHHGAGRDVGQVVDRVSEQPHRARQQGQQQLDQPGGRQADRADRDRPVGLPPVLARRPRAWAAGTQPPDHADQKSCASCQDCHARATGKSSGQRRRLSLSRARIAAWPDHRLRLFQSFRPLLASGLFS